MSFSRIGVRVGVSTSTARRWTVDVQLNAKALAEIRLRNLAMAKHASSVMSQGRRRMRAQWQLDGRQRACEGDLLHQAGCLLYWAEGTKSRNSLRLVNSDVHLLCLFRRFVTECFGVTSDRMRFAIHVYTGNGLSIREIENYWLRALALPRSCLRKHAINKSPAATSGVKRNKLPYGVGSLDVCRSTQLIQHIYGAIQEYGGFDEPRWLD